MAHLHVSYSLRPILFAQYSILGCPKLLVLFEKSKKYVIVHKLFLTNVTQLDHLANW